MPVAAAYQGPDCDLTPDPAAISAFASWWFQHCTRGVLEIGWLDAQGRGLIHFEQFARDDLDALTATAIQANLVPGQACYIRAATVMAWGSGPHKTTDMDFEQAPGIWSDIDTPEDFERAKTVQTIVRPNASVITGTVPHPRVQSWFRCSEPIASPDLVRSLNVRLHKLYGGDPAVVNPSRLMRLPGTIAWPWKAGRMPEVTQFVRPAVDDPRPASYPLSLLTSQLPAGDAEQRQQPAGATAFGVGGLSTVSSLLSAIRAGREWHNHMVQLVAHWVGHGRSSAEIMGHCEGWTLPGYTHEQTRREVQKAIEGARQKWSVPDQDPVLDGVEIPHPGILTAAEFMAGFVPPDYIIDGIVQRGRLYSLTSPTGHGKTAVALYAGCMVASGRSIGGVEVIQGHVIFLAGENPDDLRCRLYAACQVYQLDPAKLAMHVLPATFPLTAERAVVLRQQINALNCSPALIVVDTAAAFFPGDDDNQNVQMGEYARNLRTLTTCDGLPAVLTPAHPVKNPDKDNLLPRGGGAFLNEVDGNLTLWALVMGEITTLHWQGKIRGPDFSPINFALQEVKVASLADSRGRPITSILATLQTTEQADRASRQSQSDENVVLEWLRRLPDITQENIAINAGWVTLKGPNQPKVHRILRSLQHEKLVTHKRRKWVITEAGKAELDPKNRRPEGE